MKRWKKWVIALALLPVVLVLLALLLVYLPPVQRFAKDKAAAYAASTLGMDVSVGRVALRFPLSLVVADAYVRDATDTVLYVRELVVDIPLAPLLRQCIEVDAIELHGARVKSKSLIPFYHVEGNIDNLRLESHGVDLRGSRVIVDELELLDTDIDLCITDTAAADTTPSTPLDWVVEVRRVNIENVAFALSMPLDTMSMTSGLDRAVVEDILDRSFSRFSSYRKGEFIAMQNSACRSLFLLCEGSVYAQMVNDEGREITIDSLSAPDVLASAFLFGTEKVLPVSIVASSPCRVVTIGRECVRALVEQDRAVLNNFLAIVSDHSLFLSRKLEQFALQSLSSRLIGYLRNNRILANLQDTAFILGVTRPSLSRTVSQLVRQGVLRKTEAGYVLV